MSSATTSKTFGLHARFGSGQVGLEQKSKKANGGTCREGSQFISLRMHRLNCRQMSRCCSRRPVVPAEEVRSGFNVETLLRGKLRKC